MVYGCTAATRLPETGEWLRPAEGRRVLGMGGVLGGAIEVLIERLDRADPWVFHLA